MRLTVSYLYPVEIMPRRARAPRVVDLPDSVEVDVPEATSAEAPEAIRVERGTMPLVARAFAGALHNPLRSQTGGSPSLMLDPRDVAEELWHAGGCPYERFLERRQEAIPAGAAVIRDGRDATRVAVLARAAGLLAIDGRLWLREREPCYTLDVSGQTIMTLLLHGRKCRSDEVGFAFALDRLDVAREVGRLAGRAGMKFHESSSQHRVDLSAPPGLGFDEDVHNAAVALRLAVRSAGREIEALDPGAIRKVAEAAELAGRLESGRSPPQDGLAVLEAIADACRRDAPKVAAICEIGRAAVEASRPSPRGAASLDALAEDADTLAALGPR